MGTLLFDLKHALRFLGKRKLSNLAAVLSIGASVAACTAVFSFVNAVLLKPAPYPDPERLTLAWQLAPEKPDQKLLVAPDLYDEWASGSRLFQSLAAFVSGPEINFDLESRSATRRIPGALVTSNFFSTLGVSARLGRVFGTADDEPGGPRLALLGQGLWKELGADPLIVGKPLRLSGTPYEVIGVLPDWFQFPSGVQLWIPRPLEAAAALGTDIHPYFGVVGRLRPGVTATQAEQELTGIGGGNDNRPSGAGQEILSARVISLRTVLIGQAGPVLAALFGAVVFVLLIACSNVANLRLAQVASRVSETALSAALGASRSRLVFKSLLETFVLASAGWLWGGILLAFSLRALEAARPATLVPSARVSVDTNVLLFSLTLLAAITGAIGLAPALQASRSDLHSLLRSGRGGVGERRRLGKALVALQVSLAAVLLVGSCLLIESLIAFASIDSGFDPAGAIVFKISPPGWKYGESGRRGHLYESLAESLRAIPGATAVGAVNLFPLSGGRFPTRVAPGESVAEADAIEAEWVSATPGYLKALGVPVRSGRDFDNLDTESSEACAVIDQGLAERFWPDIEPLGQTIVLLGAARKIVGVAGGVAFRGFGQPATPQVYIPEKQSPLPWPFMSFVVRTSGDPSRLFEPVRTAVSALDPDLAVEELTTVQDRLQASFSSSRFAATLLTAFSFLALFLAGVGVYSCLTGHVQNGANEIGVRMALGATRLHILRSVVGRGLGLAVLGLVTGTGGAALLSRLVVSLLYDVTPLDPVAYLATWSILLAIAGLASWIPARRAMALDPAQLLRSS